MKTAFSYWNNRIAPVFDTADEIQLVESVAEKLVSSQSLSLSTSLPITRCQQLSALGVNALVCGAISKPLQTMLNADGIRVVPFVAGELQHVVRGWLKNRLEGNDFAMPGCRRGGNAVRGRRDGEGNGRGRGSGRPRARLGRGPGYGGLAVTSSDGCRCPVCGYCEPHQRGVPCIGQSCPQCGTAMVRR